MRRKLRQVLTLLGILVIMSVTIGCNIKIHEAKDEQQIEEVIVQNEVVEKEVIPDNHKIRLKDKKSLYNDSPSVVTMYLTVRKGSEEDGTQFTWKDVNENSVYFYEYEGIDRYKVEAILQVGDKSGPLIGKYGYGEKVPNATVSIRGQSSSRGEVKSYKIALKEGKGSWENQRIINLNKHLGDSLRFRNKLCYDLMKDLPDMMSFQTQFVHLYVKDETVSPTASFVDYGLYTHVEQPNKAYLETHGLDKYGHLYKVNQFDFKRYQDIIVLEEDENYDQRAFESLLEAKGNTDHSKLIRMLDAVNNYNIPIEQVFEEWFEENNFFSWLAFHILVGNRDTQARNTLLYSPLHVDTFYFISWDNDVSFKRAEDEISHRARSNAWDYGISTYWTNTLINRVLKSEVGREKLTAKVEEYYTLLTPEKIKKQINQYRGITEMYRARVPDSKNIPLTLEEYQKVVSLLPNEIKQNYNLYKKSLEDPMPFYSDIPVQTEDGIRYQWNAAYDFDFEPVHYTFEIATDYQFKNVIIKRENLTIPKITTKKLKPGRYFMRIKATNASGRSQYSLDYHMSSGSTKEYGVRCFDILEDGRIEDEIYLDAQ